MKWFSFYMHGRNGLVYWHKNDTLHFHLDFIVDKNVVRKCRNECSDKLESIF